MPDPHSGRAPNRADPAGKITANARGFSLIELLIIVVIIAVIAAIAVPRASRASRHASAAAIAVHLERMANAFEMHHAEHGSWPADRQPGVMPPEMSDRLRQADFGPSPAGGVYDWQNWTEGGEPLGGCIVSISNGIFDWDLLTVVDDILDDGDLKTGVFVRHSTTKVTSNGTMAGLRLLVE